MSTWIWPHNELNVDFSFDYSGIETFFAELYKPFPVLYFSRGRVVLTTACQMYGGEVA